MRIKIKHLEESHKVLLTLAFLALVACPSVSQGIETPEVSQSHKAAGTDVFQSGSLRWSAPCLPVNLATAWQLSRTKKGRQWIYREGDLVGKILIKRILYDRIIIDAGSGETALKLKRSPRNGSGMSLAAYRHDQINGYTESKPDKGLRDRYYVINREDAAAIFSDPENLLAAIDMHLGWLPNADTGVRISSIGSGSIFENMGLRNGDLIFSANDQEIRDPVEAVPMFQTLLNSSTFNLKIRRWARTYRIHLQIQ